jgi:hypothetical protein
MLLCYKMEEETPTKLPANLLFVAEQLSHYNRNRFRIEPTSSSQATAGRIVTVNLPENALLDTASIRFHFDADAGIKGNVAGLLPEHADAFISNLEVYVNGIQVQQSASEYNTIAHALRIGGQSQDSQRSKGQLVNHSKIYGAVEDADLGISVETSSGEKASLIIDQWAGFLNQVSTRFINTQVLGNIQIRLTMAPDAVLSGCSDDKKANEIEDSDGFTISSSTPSYTLSNMYFTVDSIVVPDAYNQLLRNQLAHSVLPLNYNEYYTFTAPQAATSTLQNRFNLASGSIDKLMALNRYDKYTEFGNAVTLTGNVAGSSPLEHIGNDFVGKYFASSSFKKSADKDALDGDLRWNFTVNNVQYPQYLAKNSEAMADVAYCNDKVGMASDGILVTSPTAFCKGLAIYHLQLNHPGLGLRCQSGYNSRGINSTLGFNMSGLNAVAKESIVIAQTTAQLRISAGKQIAVSF